MPILSKDIYAYTCTLNLFPHLFICLLTHYFLCPVALPHGKVLLAMSDACGGNAARGGWWCVPNFNTKGGHNTKKSQTAVFQLDC